MNPLFPSILTTNFFNLETKLREFEKNRIDFIHLDIMDGHFVDNISFGPAVAWALKAKFHFCLDAHLMVSNPDKMIPHFIRAGVDWISFHAEATDDAASLLSVIKDSGRHAGLVLNPDTPLERVRPFLKAIDYVLLMSVFPGFGGQKFITATLERVRQLREELLNRQCFCRLQVDGGITPEIAVQLQEAGADIFVIGTSLFNADDIEKKINDFLNQLQWREK
jgi:ribulose-phosphate 3-epimerase